MTTHPDEDEQGPSGVATSDGERVVVVTPSGMGVAEHASAGRSTQPAERGPTDLVEQPAKVMRIGSMVKSLLEEVRNAPLDDAGRTHLAQVHARSIAELKDGLAPELVEELDRIALPFGEGAPSDSELRIAQASSSAGSRASSTASRRRWSPSR